MCTRRGLANSAQSIEKSVLQSNPLLEAFGNARTVRNDNSSRFGKFLKVEFDGGRVRGARMRHYLLEKARIVAPGTGERNYHMFYNLVRGASAAQRATYKLGPEAGTRASVAAWKYLASPPLPSADDPSRLAHSFVPNVDDAADFADICAALSSVGLGTRHQDAMWAVVAGVLHLGNVGFEENAKAESAIVGGENSGGGGARAHEAAAAILGTPGLPTKLVRRLVKVKGRTSMYDVCLTAKQAYVARDSLAKMLYERCFTWLITQCNARLASQEAHEPTHAFIGVLDIFGFEIFEVNSFEQLCINYCNEKCGRGREGESTVLLPGDAAPPAARSLTRPPPAPAPAGCNRSSTRTFS